MAWLASGNSIKWRPTLADWLAALSLLRAAGWGGAIDAAIGFIDHNRWSTNLEVRELTAEWQAYSELGRQKRVQLRTMPRKAPGWEFAKMIGRTSDAMMQKRGSRNRKAGKALANRKAQQIFPAEWISRESEPLPNPNAPYLGETKRIGDEDCFEGWKEITAAWSTATGESELSPKATAARLAKA
jgi:hypothetical protein